MSRLGCKCKHFLFILQIIPIKIQYSQLIGKKKNGCK